MIRRLIALTALAFCVAVLAPSIASAHHTTTTCVAPATWQIANSEPIPMTYTTDAGHSGSIGPNGTVTVNHNGNTLTVYGVWANGQTNTSTGEGQCQTTTTTVPETASTTTTTTVVVSTSTTSTTVAPDTTTSTTATPTTATTASTSSSVEPTSTTSEPSSPPPTSGAPSTTPPVVSSTTPAPPTDSGTLPATGSGLALGGPVLAAALLGAGGCLLYITRRRPT